MGRDAHNLKRNLLFNTVGSMFYFICQWLITGLFVMRLSGAAGVYNSGLLATAAAVTNVFLTMASYGMRTFQVSDTQGKYSDATYITSRIVTVCAAILLCGIYTLVLGYGLQQTLCIYIYLLYKLLESITDVFHGCAQKQDRMDVIGISYGVRGLLSVVVFAGVLLFSNSLIWALLAMTALCYVFSIYYDIWRTRPFYMPLAKPEPKSVWSLLWECAPLAIYVFLNTATASQPKLMLERLSGTEAIGIYNLVNAPVMILQVGVAYLFAPFITIFATKLSSGDRAGFRKLAALITLGVAGVGVVGIFGVHWLGEWGLNLLYGAEIVPYGGLLTPMVICVVFTSISLFYCMLLTVLRDIKGLVIANLIGYMVSVAVSTPLVNAYNMFGTSYATIIALAVQCTVLGLFGLWDLKKPKHS